MRHTSRATAQVVTDLHAAREPLAGVNATLILTSVQEMAAHDLRAAAHAVRDRGWATGRTCDAAGRVCILGAIRVAVAGAPNILMHQMSTDQRDRFDAAETALWDHLAVDHFDADPVLWNDLVAGSGEQVAELLETVAACIWSGRMTVTVRDRSAEAPWGSPGLISPAVRQVVISAYCPTCGEPRGEPRGVNYVDDGAHYWVQTWRNPCGHVDRYSDVIREADALAGVST